MSWSSRSFWLAIIAVGWSMPFDEQVVSDRRAHVVPPVMRIDELDYRPVVGRRYRRDGAGHRWLGKAEARLAILLGEGGVVM